MTYEIVGARGDMSHPQDLVERARAWAADRGASVLLADASVVFGRDHAESAVRHALRAHVAGTGSARDLGLETLRYLCAQRQVSDAIRVGGLKKGTDAAAVVVFDAPAEGLLTHLGWSRDDGVLAPESKSLRSLGLSRAAETTVPKGRIVDLALERTALVDLEK